MSGSMQSNVGNSQIYEANEQRPNPSDNTAERFHEGQPNSHKALDSKDERTIANKLAREEQREKEDNNGLSKEAQQSQRDPTLPAQMHGNEPSRGAKIDAEIQRDEEETLRKKGAI